MNSEVKDISGSIVYLDKSTKHMYELNNKVRLIDVSRYMIENESEFWGSYAVSFLRIMIWNRCILTAF